MITSQITGESWTLSDSGKTLLSSRPNWSFITAVRREKTYKANRGTVKTTVTETDRIPLTAAREETEGAVRLSGKDHSVLVRFHEIEGGVKLSFEGREGWAYEFRLPAAEDEAVFGGGEQYRKVNLRGETVVNFVSEHIKAATIIEKAVTPMSRYKEKDHKDIGSYAPMPVFVTDRRRLILFDTTADGYSDFSGKTSLQFAFDSCPAGLTLLTADSYEQLSLLLAKQIPNRQYLPEWCFDGMILSAQGGSDQILKKTFGLLDAGAKISAVWSQDWSGCNRTVMGYQVWWNWEADEKLYPHLKQTIRKLNDRGVRFLAYINPYLVKGGRLYEFCREKGYLITRKNGEIYHIRSTTFDAGMLDLTNPDAVDYIKKVLIGRNMLDLGVSGWMADFGEYLPVDCVLHDGDPAKLHNQWPVLWAKVNREAIEEYGAKDVMFFTRSGYLGIQSYAPILWNGDQHTDYTRDYGMPCVMPASFSLAFSGVPMVHCDIGGFFSFAKMRRDSELFIRWMEMGTFSLLMRTHESIRPRVNAQPYDRRVKPYTARLTRVHTALKPYLTEVAAAAGKGLPALRPDFWTQADYSGSKDPYAYFLGEDLFVCPVIRKGVQKRQVFLPEGEWVHLWSGKEYTGGERHLVPAPLGEIPVFYRKTSPYAELFRRAADAIS